MAFRGEKIRMVPWKGGLVTVINPVMAKPDNLSLAENIEYGFDGRRQKRGGSKKLNKVPIIG